MLQILSIHNINIISSRVYYAIKTIIYSRNQVWI